MSGRLGWALALLLVAPGARAAAPTPELRLYLDTTARSDRGWRVRPFIREETRFREEGLVYEKLSLGARTKLAPWLSLQTYLAYAEKPAASVHKELLVGDVVLDHRAGPVELKLRLGNEWHTSGFYRYRQLHEVRWRGEALSVWAQEELRLDSDEGRMTMNDVRAGVDLSAGQGAALGLLVDWEASRRGADTWKQVLAPGVIFKTAL